MYNQHTLIQAVRITGNADLQYRMPGQAGWIMVVHFLWRKNETFGVRRRSLFLWFYRNFPGRRFCFTITV